MPSDSPSLSLSSTVLLDDGQHMPLFGLGCWDMTGSTAKQAVHTALEAGYRLFDTAYLYGNEGEIGEALQESGLNRDEFFIVTKLNVQGHSSEGTRQSLLTSLERLRLDYVDLFLIHTPISGKILESWKCMQDLKREGLTKSIGVSNFNVQHLEPLLASGMDPPVVNQCEFQPWLQQHAAFSFCRQHNIAPMGFCPVARNKKFQDGLYPVIDELSAKYKKSKAQILLRWGLQHEVITIPKSSNPLHIKENVNIFDFELTQLEVQRIDALDEGKGVSVASAAMFSPWSG